MMACTNIRETSDGEFESLANSKATERATTEMYQLI